MRAGEPAVFPTDTVVGVGVSVLHAQTPDALYKLKHRLADKPIAWLIGGVCDLQLYGENLPSYVFALAEKFWPGALTLVVSASAKVPKAFLCARNKTIGLRCPNSNIVLSLIEEIDGPLCVTSANYSGKPAPMNMADLDKTFAKNIPVLDVQINNSELKSNSSSGIASTVVDCTGENPVVLREGSITKQQIMNALCM